MLLVGELGAGKTTFAQGVGRGLGSARPVRSPTYVIVHEHRDGRVPLLHVDAYRLGSFAELADLDLDTPLPECAVLVEWGGGLAEPLAEDRLEVHIELGTGDERTVKFRSSGSRWAGAELAALAAPFGTGPVTG